MSETYLPSTVVPLVVLSVNSASLLWKQTALDVSCAGPIGQGDIKLSLHRSPQQRHSLIAFHNIEKEKVLPKRVLRRKPTHLTVRASKLETPSFGS